ncbi:peptidoglycan bridge formation glycyltransferase FemA/FemB family protein [Candidatus Microgenomates bacterium]|nr:peptidoglycan bridge formation glycyltransferase FemA/FemB family protein [Candidatus Microgenomates bacterium]
MSNTKVYQHPLQTKEWAEFRRAWGNEVIETNKGNIVLSKIPFTNLNIGTVIKGLAPSESDVRDFLKLGRQKNAVFIKFEPNVEYSKKLEDGLKSAGLVRGKTLFTPTTFIIDLTKSEEELLSSFSSKTRYNIRLSQKHGVKVIVDNSNKAFERYLELTFDTAKRQGFYAHTKKYHQLMWKHLNKNIAHLLVAKYKSQIISTWVLFAHNGVLYYPYGASSDKHRNVMANNAMMWEAIKLGKKLECKTFDLWGREEGKGFTKFKEGYNPEVVEFIGSWDLIINKPIYFIYKIAEKFRWIFLRLKAKT